MAIRLYMS
jgi:hypothetical protein